MFDRSSVPRSDSSPPTKVKRGRKTKSDSGTLQSVLQGEPNQGSSKSKAELNQSKCDFTLPGNAGEKVTERGSEDFKSEQRCLRPRKPHVSLAEADLEAAAFRGDTEGLEESLPESLTLKKGKGKKRKLTEDPQVSAGSTGFGGGDEPGEYCKVSLSSLYRMLHL